MAQILSNYQPYKGIGKARGVGKTFQGPIQGNYTSIAGASGEVVRISCSVLLPSQVLYNVVGQSNVNVSVRYTLSNPNLATHPVDYTEAAWTSAQTIAANDIDELNSGNAFSALEVTFNGNGILTVMSR